MRVVSEALECCGRRPVSLLIYSACWVLGVASEIVANDLMIVHFGDQQDVDLLRGTLHVASVLSVPFTFPVAYALATTVRALLSRGNKGNRRHVYGVTRVALFLLKGSVFILLGGMIAHVYLDGRDITLHLNGVLASTGMAFALCDYAPVLNRQIATRISRPVLVSLVLMAIALGNAVAWGRGGSPGVLAGPIASSVQLLTIASCLTFALVLWSAHLAAGPQESGNSRPSRHVHRAGR